MCRLQVEMLQQGGHISGKLLGGVAIRGVGAAACAAMIRQDHVVTLREALDLRSPTGSCPAEAGDQHDRRLRGVTVQFVVQVDSFGVQRSHNANSFPDALHRSPKQFRLSNYSIVEL